MSAMVRIQLYKHSAVPLNVIDIQLPREVLHIVDRGVLSEHCVKVEGELQRKERDCVCNEMLDKIRTSSLIPLSPDSALEEPGILMHRWGLIERWLHVSTIRL